MTAFLTTSGSYIQHSNLDVNIKVDRATVLPEEVTVVIEFPDEIRFGEEVTFTIVNYDKFLIYTAEVNLGDVRIEDDLIYYRAPSPPPDDLLDRLAITVTMDVDRMVYFPREPNDYFYSHTGDIFYVEDIIDSVSEAVKERIELIREEYDSMIAEAVNSVPVTRIPHYAYSGADTIDGASYKIEQMFPEQLNESWKSDPMPPVGGEDQYHVPSNRDTTPNVRSYLYKADEITNPEDGESSQRLLYVARNSNMDEAKGNVMDGYRYPGAIGSAVTVINSGDKLSRTYIFDIPIDLFPLEAIVPTEVMSMCLTGVEISPILIGDITGHTFFWEQIKGDTSEIVWVSDPHDKVLIINIGKLKADRTFRFWISKGTKYERYYDVVVYATPKEEIAGIPKPDNQFSVNGHVLNLKTHDTRPILLTGERLWNKEFKVYIHPKIR